MSTETRALRALGILVVYLVFSPPFIWTPLINLYRNLGLWRTPAIIPFGLGALIVTALVIINALSAIDKALSDRNG